MLARPWPRTDGAALHVERLLIDSGYLPAVANAVAVKLGPAVLLSKGMGLKAGNKPMAAYTRRPGERHGHNWPLTRGSGKGSQPFGRECRDQMVNRLPAGAAVLERPLPLPGLGQRLQLLEVHQSRGQPALRWPMKRPDRCGTAKQHRRSPAPEARRPALVGHSAAADRRSHSRPSRGASAPSANRSR